MTITPYTRVPNLILDAMKSEDMSGIEAKLTAVLVRETYGRHRDEARLTWDDMQALTGLSRASVAAAIDQVEQRCIFIRGRRSTWTTTIPCSSMDAAKNSSEIRPNDGSNSLNFELNEPENGENSSEIRLNGGSNSLKSELDFSSEIEPSSIREKKDPKGSKKKKTTPTPPPDHNLAEMVNALVDATGMSGRLNWGKLSDLARELLDANYTAAQVKRAYGPGGWWFNFDWRGQKGQRPGVTAIRETILQAVEWDGQIPARASPTGPPERLTRAEAAAVEYAAMKASF